MNEIKLNNWWREVRLIDTRTKLRRCLIVSWASKRNDDERDSVTLDLVGLVVNYFQGHHIEVQDPKALTAVSFKYGVNALNFKKYLMLTVKRIKIKEGWAKV